jgi:hypothetical protein
MGRILAPFGVKGWVKVQSYSDTIENLAGRSSWWLGRDGAEWREVKLAQTERHGNRRGAQPPERLHLHGGGAGHADLLPLEIGESPDRPGSHDPLLMVEKRVQRFHALGGSEARQPRADCSVVEHPCPVGDIVEKPRGTGAFFDFLIHHISELNRYFNYF